MKYTLRNSVLLAASTMLVLAAFTSANAQYDELILEAEPFAYWRLNDDDPNFEPIDSGVGDGIIGTFDNVELLVDGIVPDDDDKAVRFNGAGLIRIPDDPQTNSGGPYEEKTVELWFSADNALTETPQVLFEVGGTTRGIAMYVHDGEIIMGAWNRNDDDGGVSSPWANPNPETGPDEESIFFRRSIQSNTAYHAALVMDGDTAGKTGTLTAYLDGATFGQETGVGQLFNHGDDLGIGGMDTNIFLIDGTNPGGDGLFLEGVLDEVALYNVALDTETILAHALIEPRVPPGDFDNDGDMDLQDFMVMVENFGGTFGRNDSVNMGDFNRDRTVDLADFRDFRNAFQPAGAAAASVPEPTGSVLLGLGLFAGLLSRRRRSL